MSDPSRRYICVQIGARRGYAVPAILAEAGLLERFYTEMCGNAGLGRGLCVLPPVLPILSRLAGRQVPESVRRKTYTFGLPVIRHALRSLSGANGHAADLGRWQVFARDLSAAMIDAGCGEATHVYSMGGEGDAFLAHARERGLRIVSEAYLAPSAERIVADERRAFPGWEDVEPEHAERLLERERAMIDRSDFLVCPSEVVQDDLVTNWGVRRRATRLVPYGTNPEWGDMMPIPMRGRILFAGTADLRKGIHYFAMAAERLWQRGHRYEFRVAGHASEAIRRQPLCRRLTFLGRIPRSQIQHEFLHADMLVLPSLAEGSAGVTYEAIASSLPVVTTKSAGSVVRDGIEGLIVPERDPEALADAMARITEDRFLRERMAMAARRRAQDFTRKRYGERLLSALADIG